MAAKNAKGAKKKSEYLPQRRQGAKALIKKFFSELGVFAPWREEHPKLSW
jgi:hypothetical protein